MNFLGDEASFFSRESGLYCRTFQSLGIESKAIMLAPGFLQDAEDVLRARYEDLCDPRWWSSLNLDGLVLYSWAAPRYNAIALAASHAAIPTVVVLDTHGLTSRLGDAAAWWKFGWRPGWAQAPGPLSRVFYLLKFYIDSCFLVTARRRVRHLECCRAATMPTRMGVFWMKRELAGLHRLDLAEKIHYSPHPQKVIFRAGPNPKENLVLCAARFLPEDWPQKRPALLLEVLNSFLEKEPGWKAVVAGRGALNLAPALGVRPHQNIRFFENLSHQELLSHYQRAKIGLWTSLWEGQQGTGAQALCCGCSVVAPGTPLNTCFSDYVSEKSGRLSAGDSAPAILQALLSEVESWQDGGRDPKTISAFWGKVFYAEQAARRVLHLLSLDIPSQPASFSPV